MVPENRLSARKARNWDKTDVPGHLLDHFPDEIGNLFVHPAVLVRVREALSSEFLLNGVEGFVEVVAVIGTSRPRSGCGCGGGGGVHVYGGKGIGFAGMAFW